MNDILFGNNNKQTMKMLSVRYLRANKSRNIIAVIAIALTTILFTTIFTLGSGFLDTIHEQNIRKAGGDGQAVISNINDEIYQDIALCRNNKDIEDVIDEIIDRYGTMPTEVENLIEIARIKILARNANVLKLSQNGKNVVFYLDKDNIQINGDMINKLVTKYGPKIRFSQGIEPYITLNTNEKDEKKIIEIIKEMLILLSVSIQK